MESVCTLVTHQVVMMEITAPKIFVIQKVVAISLLQQDQATFQAIPLAWHTHAQAHNKEQSGLQAWSQMLVQQLINVLWLIATTSLEIAIPSTETTQLQELTLFTTMHLGTNKLLLVVDLLQELLLANFTIVPTVLVWFNKIVNVSTTLSATITLVAQPINVSAINVSLQLLIVILIIRMGVVLWTLIMQQATQQDMQSILEVPILFTLKSIQTEILLQQEWQEIVINWHVMEVIQALTLASQQELQTELTLVKETINLFALSQHAKIAFVNQLDKQEIGKEGTCWQAAMSQSLQTVMMRMFVLSMAAIRHGWELTHKVWDAFTLQTLQIAIQTTFASLGDAMQQQVVSRMQLQSIQTQLVSDIIVILSVDLKLNNFALKIAPKEQINALSTIATTLWEQVVLVWQWTKRLCLSEQPKLMWTLVETVIKSLSVGHQQEHHLARTIIAIKPMELVFSTTLVNVLRIAIVLTALVAPSINA
jgi:hypothetical protein